MTRNQASGRGSDQPPLTRWVAAHPWRWALASGSLMALVGAGLFGAGAIVLWLPVGLAFGVANGLLWRPDGAAHRWRAQLIARDERRRSSHI